MLTVYLSFISLKKPFMSISTHFFNIKWFIFRLTSHLRGKNKEMVENNKIIFFILFNLNQILLNIIIYSHKLYEDFLYKYALNLV